MLTSATPPTTRHDLFPVQYLAALETFFDTCPALNPREAMASVVSELNLDEQGTGRPPIGSTLPFPMNISEKSEETASAGVMMNSTGNASRCSSILLLSQKT